MEYTIHTSDSVRVVMIPCCCVITCKHPAQACSRCRKSGGTVVPCKMWQEVHRYDKEVQQTIQHRDPNLTAKTQTHTQQHPCGRGETHHERRHTHSVDLLLNACHYYHGFASKASYMAWQQHSLAHQQTYAQSDRKPPHTTQVPGAPDLTRSCELGAGARGTQSCCGCRGSVYVLALHMHQCSRINPDKNIPKERV